MAHYHVLSSAASGLKIRVETESIQRLKSESRSLSQLQQDERFMQVIRTRQNNMSKHILSKTLQQSTERSGRVGGRQKKWIDNVKEWKSMIILFFPEACEIS